MAGAFTDALDQLDQIFAAGSFDQDACRSAFYALAKAYQPSTPAADIRRMVAHCLCALGLGADPAPLIADVDVKRSLDWAAAACMEALLIDRHAASRWFVANAVDRQRSLGADLYEGGPEAPYPLPHVPLDLSEAKTLIAPYLTQYAAQLDTNPLAHIKLCWDVFDAPVPPFDKVFHDWLADLDADRGTQDLQSIERAMALASLAKRGSQRLSVKNCEDRLWPQLFDPHPLVAAAAARFLGDIYGDEEERLFGGTAKPLAEVMNLIATFPRHRRYVAGGFLNGFGGDMEPYTELRAHPALEGYDLADWTLKVLSDHTPEAYLPAAQSLWFYVHEHYCFDPAFITRMIDAGHLWEALMTATEMHEAVEGMKPVLIRLAACKEEGIARAAQAWIDRHYTAQ